LIGKSAIALDSLQYLVDRVLQADDGTDIRILVDVDNYRERVIEPLKDKARRLAKEVKASGNPAKLPPMATIARREVHIVAKAIPGISTISHGDGQIKSLTILSEKKSRSNSNKRDSGRNNSQRERRRD
jgi:spoIIIJ-associated protein